MDYSHIRMKVLIIWGYLLHMFTSNFCLETSKFFVSDPDYDDLLSTETFLSEITVSSNAHCGVACESIVGCKSFFYDKNIYACNLASSVMETTGTTIYSAGMKYFINKLDECQVDPVMRKECGWGGISKETCESRGCCFNSTIAGVKWCFHKRGST